MDLAGFREWTSAVEEEVGRESGLFLDARIDAIRTIDIRIQGEHTEISDSELIGVGLRGSGPTGIALVSVDGTALDAIRPAIARCRHLADSGGEVCNVASAPAITGDDCTALNAPIGIETLRGILAAHCSVGLNASTPALRYRAQLGWRAVITNGGIARRRTIMHSTVSLTAQVTSKSSALVPVPASIATGAVRSEVLTSSIIARAGAAAELAKSLASSVALTARECPVVLSPAMSALVLHEALAHPCEADRIPSSRREGWLAGMTLGPPELDVWDVPGPLDDRGSDLPFDDEGVQCRPVHLVERGRWIDRLHSRFTALGSSAELAGCARTVSFNEPPMCRMRVTDARNGQRAPAELIASIADGIYLDCPHGGHLRGGEIGLRAIDVRRIENGRLTTRYAGATLRVRPLAVLKHITGVGNDRMYVDHLGWCTRGRQRHLPVAAFAPSLSLSRAHVAPL